MLRLIALAALPILDQRRCHLDDMLEMAALLWREKRRKRCGADVMDDVRQRPGSRAVFAPFLLNSAVPRFIRCIHFLSRFCRSRRVRCARADLCRREQIGDRCRLVIDLVH